MRRLSLILLLQTCIGERRLSQLSHHLRTPLYANAYALMLSAGSNAALGFLFWILASHLYTLQSVGFNSAAISALLLLTGISQLGLPTTIVRFLPRAGNSSAQFILLAYLIAAMSALITGSIFLLGLPVLSPQLRLFGQSISLISCFLLSLTSWSLFSLQDSVLTGLRQATWVPLENLPSNVIRLALLFMFADSFPGDGIFLSWAIAGAVAILPVNLFIFRRLIPRRGERVEVPRSALRRLSVGKFMTGNYIGSLFNLASLTLLPLLVVRQAGLVANAYFYLPWMIFYSFQIIASMMSTSLVVEAALEPGHIELLARKVLVQLLRIFAPAAVLLVITGPLLLDLFGPRYATESSVALRILALATVPAAVTAVYLSVLRIYRRNLEVALVQGAVALGTVGLSMVFLPRGGIDAVAVVVLATQFVVALTIGLVLLTSGSPFKARELADD